MNTSVSDLEESPRQTSASAEPVSIGHADDISASLPGKPSGTYATQMRALRHAALAAKSGRIATAKSEPERGPQP